MDRITFFNETNSEIGLIARKQTQGDELSLVNEFIDFYCDRFSRTKRTRNLAVFIEPRIVSGFPDIVFAEYSPSIVDQWSDMRADLDLLDLKVLFYLIDVKGTTGCEIITKLKLPERQVLQSIEKLLNAKLIHWHQGIWCSYEIDKVFSLKKLMAVEAKIGDVRKVAEQTFVNTWFASHSFAVMDSCSPQSSTVNKFQKHGIGLYCKDKDFKKIIEAREFKLPSSIGSLQFNEWIGNQLLAKQS